MKLSICIPTFNRRKELLRLIGSIAVALEVLPPLAEVEVIVSDNASTDGTDLAIRAVQARMPCLRYSRSEVNEGFAANLNRAVAMSSGVYCWLMGSDDAILPNAIGQIWQHVGASACVIVGNPITRSTERKFFLFEGQLDQDFAAGSDFAQYIGLCSEISSAFAFMSTLIVRRDFWNQIQCTQYETDHPYTHMLRIVRGLSTIGGRVRCLNFPVVVTGHAGNEWNATILPHFELDLSTIDYIVNSMFDSSHSILCAYGVVFRRQYGSIELLKSRVECSAERWSVMVPLLKAFGYSRILLRKTIFDPIMLTLYLRVKRLRRSRGNAPV